MSNTHKVRLEGPNGTVTFEASSPLQEDRGATYSNYSIVHLPTTLHAYHSTGGRKLMITGKLVSRTVNEANANLRNLDLIRSWPLPDFGSTGATPPILFLSGYNNNNVDRLQVVMTQYSWNFTDEVDYIWTEQGSMPVIGMLTLSLEEVYSAEQVTAGAWKTKLALDGGFRRDEDKPDSNLSIISAFQLANLRSSIKTPTLGGSLMGAYGQLLPQAGPQVRPTIAGVLAGKLARNLGTKLLNSTAVREVTKGLPPILSNIFVSGANIGIGQLGKAVTTGVSSLRLPAAPTAPSFNRDTPLVPQNFTRDN